MIFYFPKIHKLCRNKLVESVGSDWAMFSRQDGVQLPRSHPDGLVGREEIPQMNTVTRIDHGKRLARRLLEIQMPKRWTYGTEMFVRQEADIRAHGRFPLDSTSRAVIAAAA